MLWLGEEIDIINKQRLRIGAYWRTRQTEVIVIAQTNTTADGKVKRNEDEVYNPMHVNPETYSSGKCEFLHYEVIQIEVNYMASLRRSSFRHLVISHLALLHSNQLPWSVKLRFLFFPEPLRY